MTTENIALRSEQVQASRKGSTLALYALTLGAFAIGMTEFIIMGLLSEVADSLNVSIPMAGFLITGYALGVAIGAPFITLATHTIIGIVALVGIVMLVPKVANAASSLLNELRVLKRPAVHIALLMTVFGFGGVFTAFTYISPILVDITGFSSSSVSYILVLFGVGITIGNIYGGKLADRSLFPSLLGILVGLAIILAVFSITDQYKILTLMTVFVLGIAAFGTVPGLQLHMLNTAKEAPMLASTLNIAAFNLGNALGAYLGGIVIDTNFAGGLPAVPWVASLVTVIGILFTLWGAQHRKSFR
jgi:MFS transporter, DHA1 family, inner membrane transport protein